MPDIRTLADEAAAKIRGGYTAPHAARSVLKELRLGAEEREQLFHDILSELSRRSRRRRKKNKEDRKAAEEAKSRKLRMAIEEERVREARHMAYERGDHLLPDP